MRKVRLTEADLTRLIRRVIQEQSAVGGAVGRAISSLKTSGQPGGKPRMDVSGAFMTNNIITCMGMKDLPQACKSLISKVTGSDNKLSLNNIMGSMKDFGMCDKALGNEESINKFGACLMKEIKK